MKRASTVALVWFALLFVTPAYAQSNALNNYLGPQEIAVGEGMRASASGAQSIALNPAGLSLTRQLVFQGSYGFRPTDDASIVTVAACDSTVAIPGCFYYNYFSNSAVIGDDSMGRRTHQFGLTMSRALTENILVGVNTKYFDFESDVLAEENASGFAVDVGLIVRVGDAVNLAAVGYNLLAENTPQYPRAVATGVTLRPVPNLSLVFDSRWDIESEEETMKGARFGGGAEYFLTGGSREMGVPLRVGAVHDRGSDISYVTAGLGYYTLRLGLELGMRRQVSGGDNETMVHAGLRFFGPSVATPPQ